MDLHLVSAALLGGVYCGDPAIWEKLAAQHPKRRQFCPLSYPQAVVLKE
jgi:hypothetical protein